MGKSPGSLRLLIPGATVFFAGGCTLMLELVASRLVARALGSSLLTWTSVIAVVLTGLSIGGFVGGRLADRFHVRRVLSVLLALSSASCVVLVVVNNVASDWTWLWRVSWLAHVVVHVCLVFLLPSILLGAVGPVAGKMALDQGLPPGYTLGALFGCAMGGGITAALLTGLFLIAGFGSTAIVWGLGATLLVLAFLYWVSCWVLYLWAMIFAALALMGMAPADWAHDAGVAAALREPDDPSVIYADETPYVYLSVQRVTEKPDRRMLWQDQRQRSRIVFGDVSSLESFQAEVGAALARRLNRQTPLAALILGGDYALAQYLQEMRPDSDIEVVEVDPGVTKAAHQALGLPGDTAIRTVRMDARVYLNRLTHDSTAQPPGKRYDFIYADVVGDAFVPFAQMTFEFNEKVAALLSDDGLYAISLSDVREGGRFLGVVVATLEQTFSHVWVIGSGASGSDSLDTYVVVAAQRDFDPEEALSAYNEHLVCSVWNQSQVEQAKNDRDETILTDDYAPVANLLTPAVWCSDRQRLAQRYLRDAVSLQSQGHYERCITRYRQAAEQDPVVAMRAHSAVGDLCLQRDDQKGAVKAFQKALAGHIETGLHQAMFASTHLDLGVLLQKMDRRAEARTHLADAARYFRMALQHNPHSVFAWESLGDTLIASGELREAAAAFEKALALDPQDLTYYDKLSKILEVQRRYDEAVAVIRRQIDLLKSRGQRDAVLELGRYIDFLEYQNAKQ